MLFTVLILTTVLQQEGTGDIVRSAESIPNRPQYEHPGGPVRPRNMLPPMSWSHPFKACISIECRLFCKPDNEMRPECCSYYNPPKDGYIELRPQLVQ